MENGDDTRLEKLREILKTATNLDSNEDDPNQTQESMILEKLKNVWNELGGTKCETSSEYSMEEFVTELKVLETTSSLLGKCIREFRVTSGRKFTPDDFATKLLAKLTTNVDEVIDWMMFADNCIRIINRAPGIRILLGTIDLPGIQISSKIIKPKKQKTVVKREFVPGSEKKEMERPDQIQSMEVDHNSVDSKVENIMKILRHCCNENNGNPISFYQLVLHPSNFTITVENIFHLSFIIRDGLARLDTVGDEIVIEPVKTIESKRSDGSGSTLASKYQMVFSISFDEWQNLLKTYNIQEPLIK